MIPTYTLVVLVKLMIAQQGHQSLASCSTSICHSLLPEVDLSMAYLGFYYLKNGMWQTNIVKCTSQFEFFLQLNLNVVPNRPPRLWGWFNACAANAWFTSLLFSAFWAWSIFVCGGCCDNGTFPFNGCCACCCCCCGCILFTSDGIGGNPGWVCCIWAACGVDCIWRTDVHQILFKILWRVASYDLYAMH